jgi:hypothetical protein
MFARAAWVEVNYSEMIYKKLERKLISCRATTLTLVSDNTHGTVGHFATEHVQAGTIRDLHRRSVGLVTEFNL